MKRLARISAQSLFILFFELTISGQSNLDVIKVTDPDNPKKTIDCGLEGNAHDGTNKMSHLAWVENPHKNRHDIPDPQKINVINIEDLIASNADKSKFKMGDPVEVTAYVFDVKYGGTESCNCGTKDNKIKDTHIELTPDKSKTSEKYRFVVEITPRLREEMKKQGIDWSTPTLSTSILHKTITVQGWLFYDEIHEPEAFATNPLNKPNPKTGKKPNWRASCWEVHPITSMSVQEGTKTNHSGNSNCPETANCGCSGKKKADCEASSDCCKWTKGKGCGCK